MVAVGELLMRDPVGRAFTEDRPITGAVGLDDPHPLRRVTAGFMAVEDFAGDEGVGLDVPHPE